jgi:hypothetical protein
VRRYIDVDVLLAEQAQCVELGFLATFWLTRHRGLQRVAAGPTATTPASHPSC